MLLLVKKITDMSHTRHSMSCQGFGTGMEARKLLILACGIIIKNSMPDLVSVCSIEWWEDSVTQCTRTAAVAIS